VLRLVLDVSDLAIIFRHFQCLALGEVDGLDDGLHLLRRPGSSDFNPCEWHDGEAPGVEMSGRCGRRRPLVPVRSMEELAAFQARVMRRPARALRAPSMWSATAEIHARSRAASFR
jgi:hypothetical protein